MDWVAIVIIVVYALVALCALPSTAKAIGKTADGRDSMFSIGLMSLVLAIVWPLCLVFVIISGLGKFAMNISEEEEKNG